MRAGAPFLAGRPASAFVQRVSTLSGGSSTPALTYETLTFTASGNLTVTGNGTSTVNIFKTSGSASWDNQAYVSTGFVAPITIEFNKTASSSDDGASYAMISLNADPTTDASYTSLDWASYPYTTTQYSVYHNSSAITPPVAAWSTAAKWYLVYGVDGFIRHYNGATQMYSVNKGAGQTVYIDSSFYSVSATNGGFSNIRAIKKEWNGTTYV